MTADKESIANPLKIKAKKFDQRAHQALSVSPPAIPIFMLTLNCWSKVQRVDVYGFKLA